MTWDVELAPDAVKWLRKADPQVAPRIRDALRALTALDSPRYRGAPLTGALSGLWRYRVGDYRIICDLHDERLVVLVIEIGHRAACTSDTG